MNVRGLKAALAGVNEDLNVFVTDENSAIWYVEAASDYDANGHGIQAFHITLHDPVTIGGVC